MTHQEAADLIMTAEGLLDLGDPEHSWAVLDQLPSEFQRAKRVLHLRVKTSIAMKEWQTAEFLVETLIAREPTNGDFLYAKAVSLCQQGKVADAKTTLKKALLFDDGLRAPALNDSLLEPVRPAS